MGSFPFVALQQGISFFFDSTEVIRIWTGIPSDFPLFN